MGLYPLTPEDIELYQKERERAEKFTRRRQAVFKALGIEPIPKEQYTKYLIREAPMGIVRPSHQCDKCGSYLHHHPIGVIRIGDNWYDFLDLEKTILKHLDTLVDVEDFQ